MFRKCCPQGLMFRKCCPQGLMFRKCCPQGLMFRKCCPQGLMFRKCCPQGLMFRKCCPQGLMASCIHRLTDDAVACCFEILLNFEISCLLYLFASCLTPGLIDNLKTSAETTLVNKFGLAIDLIDYI